MSTTASENDNSQNDSEVNFLQFTWTYRKPGKLPAHWKYAMPIKWKRSLMLNALYRAKRILTSWEFDLDCITNKFKIAGFL